MTTKIDSYLNKSVILNISLHFLESAGVEEEEASTHQNKSQRGPYVRDSVFPGHYFINEADIEGDVVIETEIEKGVG